ncbi:MAG: J domain-containing protein [Clostridia bacterium]|nr:J domain-containing protein [Clostridia bacterium]
MKNYYEILEVSENASSEVIEKAYRALAKKYHPDMWPRDKIFFAESKFKEITEAYKILSNEISRRDYDMKLGLNNNLDDKYNALYSEHEKLKQEINNIKSNKYINNTSNSNKYIKPNISVKKYVNDIREAIKTEANKPKDERDRDFKALILTIIVVSILLFVFLKIPFLKKLLFP